MHIAFGTVVDVQNGEGTIRIGENLHHFETSQVRGKSIVIPGDFVQVLFNYDQLESVRPIETTPLEYFSFLSPHELKNRAFRDFTEGTIAVVNILASQKNKFSKTVGGIVDGFCDQKLSFGRSRRWLFRIQNWVRGFLPTFPKISGDYASRRGAIQENVNQFFFAPEARVYFRTVIRILAWRHQDKEILDELPLPTEEEIYIFNHLGGDRAKIQSQFSLIWRELQKGFFLSHRIVSSKGEWVLLERRGLALIPQKLPSRTGVIETVLA